jgi:hypothetical protein
MIADPGRAATGPASTIVDMESLEIQVDINEAFINDVRATGRGR